MTTLVNLAWFGAGALSAMIGMVAVLFLLEAIARDDPEDIADRRHEADREQTLSRSQGSSG